MSKRKSEAAHAKSKIEPVEEVAPDAPVEPVIGVVTGCVKLNIRVAPDIKSDIICDVLAGTPLWIDDGKSTDEWFSVCTAVGVDGFCLRSFIEIK